MKTNRTIIVDGKRYHWAIRPKMKTSRCNHIHVGIWAADKGGQKLNVRLRFDNPWLECKPMDKRLDMENPLATLERQPITTGEIRKLIIAALKNGWTPETKAPQIHFFAGRGARELRRVRQADYDKQE